MQKAALTFSRLFVGILFIFSGLIKANDPLGFGYKLQEYFDVFHMPWLSPMATGIAIFLCILEIVLGALLLAGFWSRKVTTGLLFIIIFFTFLTFVSAAFKVVTSCGCFGDAIPLTPWQSFSKDLILLVLIVYLFINRNLISPLTANPSLQRTGLIGITILSLAFSLYTYTFLPILDFLPYKIGQSIPDAMQIPPGKTPDEYQIMYQLKHKVSGEKKEMSDKDYLKTEIWKDNNWEIVGEPSQKLLKKGFEPKIKDLMISDASGTDYTKEIIENPYYNLIIVAYYLKDTDIEAIQELNKIAAAAAKDFNIRTVLLTSSSAVDAENFNKTQQLMSEIFYSDAVPLKSMVRSNPGLMLMKNGIVINKWSHAGLPDYETLKTKYLEK